MKSNRNWRSSRPRRAPRGSTAAGAAQREQDRLGGEHRGEQRDDDADAEREREALTPAVARMNRMNATSSVTTFASMIVASPSCSPRRCRATERPARISSLMRSKTTMFASAATPSVRIRPAMPGSVSVIGISLTSA
jgi:hypothetical protein